MLRCIRLFLWTVAATIGVFAVALSPGCREEGLCPSHGRGSDHLLLQKERGHVLSQTHSAGPAVNGGGCSGMPDVKSKCSPNDCKVLAGNMRGFSCRDFCRRSGRKCVAAWEEVNNDCAEKQKLACDEAYGDTSDLLCECAPEVLGFAALGSGNGDGGRDLKDLSTAGRCKGMPSTEQTCSPDGCLVLATNMRHSSCSTYCAKTGRACLEAFEEVDETCSVKEVRRCDQVYDDTSDLLCRCSLLAEEASQGKSDIDGDLGIGAPPVSEPRRELVWSDEFNGWGVDRSKWEQVHAGGGFGNQERQFYRSSNAQVRDGSLFITARCEDYWGHSFTSAKLTTERKAHWGPGHRMEVRAKFPVGKGTWPAIWMLPARNLFGDWPDSGEIDIVEAVGCDPNKVHGTVHTGDYNHMRNTQAYGTLETTVTEWHVYSIDWTKEGMQWSVDDQLYGAFSPDARNSGRWPFDEDFYLILNLAVGGSWGGHCLHGRPSCNSPEEFLHEQVMQIDYVRVYRII